MAYQIMRKSSDSIFLKTANIAVILLLTNFSCVLADERHKRQANAPSGSTIFPFRQAPICVDWENLHPEEKGLARFTSLFEYYRNNIYIPVSNGVTSPTGLIKRFDLSAINILDHDSGYNDTLRNWVHIDIESEAELEGLYVQAISAPWGLPFGEFISSFDCDDCVASKTSDFKDFINIVPCGKRAALSYTHPNVFTVGGAAITDIHQQREYFTRIHFNFRYTQYPGLDHTYAQFLVIAVRNFKGNHTRFETFFTPIYELHVEENPIGAFYPFYAGWETKYITCHKTGLENSFKPFAGGNPKLKLRINRDFDECLQNTEEDNLKWFTCPPGPILMDQADIPNDLPEWVNLRNNKYLLTGDPAVDPQYGDNPQFCADAGIWDWTAGNLEWPHPQVDLIMEGNETLNLTYVVEAEQPSQDGYSCEEIGAKDVCIKETKTLNASSCMDYHSSACSKDDLDQLGIVPLYGKDNETGEYQLSNRLCSNLSLTEQIDVAAIHWGNKFVLVLHGKLMIFTWTVTINIIAFTARFMKEYTVMEKRSSYFGIGNWLWNHIIWSHIGWISVFSGVYLVAHHHETFRKPLGSDDSTYSNLHDLCNLHRSKNETEICFSYERKTHGRMGMVAFLFLFLSYVSGWGRPVNTFLRKLVIIYHYGMAYLGKILFYVIIAYGKFGAHTVVDLDTFIAVVVIDLMAAIMFFFATVLNHYIDKQFAIEGRSMCPVPEGINIYDFSPQMQATIRFLLPVHVVIQLVCFFVIHRTFELEENLCKLK